MPGHMVATCKARECIYGPYAPKSSAAASTTAQSQKAPPPDSLAGSSLSFEQRSQLESYLAQNRNMLPDSSCAELIAMFVTTGLSTWILDQGAIHQMTPDQSILTQPSNPSNSTYIYMANGSKLHVCQIGNIITTSDSTGKLTLPQVLCIPKLPMQLISVGQIINLNCYIFFGPTSCAVQDHTGRQIGACHKTHGLY